MSSLSPIILFVYDRLSHTKKTIEALQNNELATESELFIFSDAAKTKENQESVENIRHYIQTIDGFKKITVIKRDKNWGLANSIIDGVTQIINKYHRVIVLEDDLVTSPQFLNYMNDALDFYKEKKGVWHISAWNYPMDESNLNDTFLWRIMNCWGWATWSDRWKFFNKNPEELISSFSKEDINKFSLDNSSDFWKQVIANNNGISNTWAIFWYATIFMQKGLCLNPALTYVSNIGRDGSGTNSVPITNNFDEKLNVKKIILFENDISENKNAIQQVYTFFLNKKKITLKRIMNKFIRVILSIR